MAKSKSSGSPIDKLYKKHQGAERKNLPTGNYVIQFRSLSITKDGDKPNARLTGVVKRGEFEGSSQSIYWNFYDRKDKEGNTVDGSGEEQLRRFMEDMASLGIDTSEIPEIEGLVDEIASAKPTANVKAKQNGQYTNLNIVGLVEGDEEDDEEADEEDVEDEEEEEEEEEEEKPAPKKTGKKAPPKKDEEEEEEEEEEETEEEDEEEEEEEEDEAVEPTKGAICFYVPPKGKKPVPCTVNSVNKKAQTVSLTVKATGKKFDNIAWSDIEVEADEE